MSLDQDIFIDHNIKSPEGDKNSNYSQTSLKEMNDPAFMNQMNLDHNIDTHHPNQLRGSPFIEKNNNCPFLKIKNPWIIKTPPGYSCLFTPPLNNQDDRFSIISGIVDTDTYPLQINFPFTINGDKYKTLTTVLKKGTPFVQVIPFKRDNWKMSIKSFDEKISKENIEGSFKFNSLILHKYKQVFWGKKKCK